jgi:hypothetical protein
MYDVASVDSDTQITLSAPYAGVTASGVVYAIGTGFTVPDSFPEMSQGDIETATIFTRAMRTIQSKFTGIAINTTAEIGQAVSDHEATNDHPLATTSAKGFLSAVDKTKLDTVESGATADQTKADIDALNIDAGTLDSLNSTEFVRSSASNGILSSSDDLDSITIPGHYGWNTDVPVNAPFGKYCVMIVERDGAQSIQLVYGSTSGQMAMRRANSGTYGGWTVVLTPAMAYFKTEVNNLLNAKADQATTYTETEVDGLLDEKAAISGQTFTGDIAAPKITASTGVLFGTDTAAANTLDDYERGNWTPVADSGITGWASLESATYVKIGDLVTVNVFVESVTGKDANKIQLSGLPFTSKGGRHFSPGPCEIADLSTSSDSPFVRTTAGADTLNFFKGAREDVAGNDVTGAGNIIFTISYQSA